MHPVHGVERREGGRVSVLWARGVSFSWWSRLGAEEGERGENWILKRGHQVALLCCQRSGPNLQSTEKAAFNSVSGEKEKTHWKMSRMMDFRFCKSHFLNPKFFQKLYICDIYMVSHASSHHLYTLVIWSTTLVPIDTSRTPVNLWFK